MAPVWTCIKKGRFLWQSSRPIFAHFVGKLGAKVCEQLLSLAEAPFILMMTTSFFSLESLLSVLSFRSLPE